MLNQLELIDQVLEVLNKKGILDNLIIVGSWCLYFYKHHFKEASSLANIRTLDIDIDVNLLRKKKIRIDIPELLNPLGFDIKFHSDDSIILIHPEIKMEFLVSEKGRPTDKPVKLPGFGITAQPLRWLDFLEEEIITVNYKNLHVKIPHPVRFAIHKLIISQRRRGKKGKHQKDIIQAFEVLNMLVMMNQKQKIIDIINTLTRKQKKLIRQALKEDIPEGLFHLSYMIQKLI